VEEAQPSAIGVAGVDPLPIVREAVASLAPILRHIGRVSVSEVAAPFVAVHAVPLREVVELALLDAATVLDETAAAGNRLAIAMYDSPDGDAVIEITASGTLVSARCSAEPIGSAVCGERMGELGGDLEIATTLRDRRVIRLVLPRGYG